MDIVGISGSLRQHSYNAGVLRAAAGVMPAGATLRVVPIAGIPLYDADSEAAQGLPAPVIVLKDAIAGADAVLIATPEYNNGIPGVFKNAIDWASRPPADIPKVFGGKQVAIIGASPGGFGTVLAQAAWLPVLKTLGAEVWAGGRLMVAGAGKAFDEQGNLVDDAVRERLAKFLADFVSAVGPG